MRRGGSPIACEEDDFFSRIATAATSATSSTSARIIFGNVSSAKRLKLSVAPLLLGL